MSKFIDCHTHLYDDSFDNDIGEVVSRAVSTGVHHALVVAEKQDDFGQILKLAERFPAFCLPCFGVHPVQGIPGEDRRSVTEKDLEIAIPWIREHHEKLIAIGEVGLDFTPRFCKSDDDKEVQRSVLRKQVELAKEYDLPLNVHSRSAGRPTIALLKECQASKVLLHAFDGKPSVAMEGVQCGYFFSIPPSIVRSAQQKLVERLPLESLLLETDSPALGPEKEGRNEPQNLKISCEYIARIKKMDIETVANIMWENTLKLFPRIQKFIPR